MLVSIAIAWTPTAFAATSAVGDTGVSLSPAQGPPKKAVHLSYGICFTKDSDEGSRPGTITSVRFGSGDIAFTASNSGLTGGADFTVPSTAAPGPHSVSATCDNGAGVISGTATFQVRETGTGDGGTDGGGSPSPHHPSLTLHPTEVLPGGSVDVHGSDFAECRSYKRIRTVDVSVNNIRLTEAGIDARTGDFRTVIRVPADATPRGYTMTAACTANEKVVVESKFKVLARSGGNPGLTLDPGKGTPGTVVTASGSGFNCPGGNIVNVTWDKGARLTSTDVSAEGDFRTRIKVPEGSAAKAHTVRAECGQEPRTTAEADFQVTETDTGTGASGNATDGEVTGGTGTGTGGGGRTTSVGSVIGPSAFGAALLLAAAVFGLLHHRNRGPRWARDHVRTTLRPGTGAADLLERREADAANHTVRLEPHTDPGDQNLD